ncbi:helix-turn-helix domain-containing protein [Streptomyces sp. NPDC060002]|uniref:helix-turn-helix domain-containing protein n=1 Tax=Streptomyces sp. NPDC060002 TaxID=3347033 RepID=UPI003694C23A
MSQRAGYARRSLQKQDLTAQRETLHQSGEHTIAGLAELFSVSRATVYRVLERHQKAPAPSTSGGQ